MAVHRCFRAPKLYWSRGDHVESLICIASLCTMPASLVVLKLANHHRQGAGSYIAESAQTAPHRLHPSSSSSPSTLGELEAGNRIDAWPRSRLHTRINHWCSPNCRPSAFVVLCLHLDEEEAKAGEGGAAGDETHTPRHGQTLLISYTTQAHGHRRGHGRRRITNMAPFMPFQVILVIE